MTSTRARIRVLARLLGAASAIVGLVAATLLAVALTDLAQRRLAAGLWLLAVIVAVRWSSSTLAGLWGEHAGDVIRDQWRRALPTHFTRPRSERERGRGDLALAIERVADEPTLDLLAASAGVALLGLGVLWWAGGWLSLAITIGLLALAVPLYQRAGRRSEAVSHEYVERRALLASRQLELLHHTPELRALGAVGFGADEIAAISDSEHLVALRAIRVALESSLVTEFLSGVSIGLVAMVAGFALLGARTTLTHALIAVLVTSELFLHVRRYGVEFHRRENATASLNLLATSLTTASRFVGDALIVATDLVTQASPASVNLRVQFGDRVLVTGPSGSGKTTLLQTLVDWRSPVRGEVRRTSSAIGYVSAESALVSGTLRENLMVGGELDDDVMRVCLGSLGLVGTRFGNLDTVLLADGRGFSTGERVRLVLARALLADAALLVLDDVAGVLDEVARGRVRDVLEQRRDVAVIEATVDRPLLNSFGQHVVVAT